MNTRYLTRESKKLIAAEANSFRHPTGSPRSKCWRRRQKYWLSKVVRSIRRRVAIKQLTGKVVNTPLLNKGL